MASLNENASSASFAVLASQRTVFLAAFPISLADILTASPTAAYSCLEAAPGGFERVRGAGELVLATGIRLTRVFDVTCSSREAASIFAHVRPLYTKVLEYFRLR